MVSLAIIDAGVSEQIRNWGRSSYWFWRVMAAQGIYGFVLIALPFVVMHKLGWWQVYLGFACSYAAVTILQRIIRRARPDFATLTGYKMWTHTFSCPSGHATMSAGSAGSIALLTDFTSQPLLVTTVTLVILLAFLVGVSRVMVGVHYVGDVLLGWLLGTLVAVGWSFLVLGI